MRHILSVVIVAYSLFAGGGDEIKLNSAPKKTNAVKLSNEVTFIDEVDGFYERISATVSPNGKVLILDQGNSRINIFSADGKLISTFGKEGSGPGEFQKNFIWGIKATNDRVYTQQWNKIMIFKHDGSLIKEIETREMRQSEMMIKDNKLIFAITPNAQNKFLLIEYSLDGERIKELKNPAYIEGYKPWETNLGDYFKELFSQPKNTQIYNGGFIQTHYLDYKIEYFDFNQNPIATLHRPYENHKYDPQKMWFNKTPDGLTKEQAANYTTRGNAYKSVYDGKISAIRDIIGVHNNYLFLELSPEEEDKNLSVHVISPSKEFYTDFKITDPENFNGLILSNGKLLLYCKNDDDGPYLKAWDIEINE